jgi:hypothetical protein
MDDIDCDSAQLGTVTIGQECYVAMPRFAGAVQPRWM